MSVSNNFLFLVIIFLLIIIFGMYVRIIVLESDLERAQKTLIRKEERLIKIKDSSDKKEITEESLLK